MTPDLNIRPDVDADVRLGDFLEVSLDWPQPTVIICDGPYGLGSFPGEPKKPSALPEWYEPHVARFTEASGPHTTLWFWNTEVGWATVHPLLERYGWVYKATNIWDKGLSHAAGNSNTQTLRHFPVVSEICVQYLRPEVVVRDENDHMSVQEWLRQEWRRTGLPFKEANRACGVRNAATRKYLTACDKWYMPPPAMFEALVEYANEHGDPDGVPYFHTAGEFQMPEYTKLRSKFHCPVGVTNVWSVPTVRGNERVRVNGHTLHPNQKPVSLMKLIISASSDPGDVVWEPFGGVCSGAVAAVGLGRSCFSAEVVTKYYDAAVARLSHRRLFGLTTRE